MRQIPQQESILHYLAAHAHIRPDATAYTVLRNGEEPERTISYATLWEEVQALACSLANRQYRDKTALLIYEEVIPFLVALLACQLAGIRPVPVPYVRGKKQVARLAGIMRNAHANLLCCCAYTATVLQQSVVGLPVEDALEVLSTDTLPAPVTPFNLPLPTSDAIALIQYTSGSTGWPKGVVISQRNLLHNQQLMQQVFDGNQASVIFSWLPFHHDMGLIGNILHTIYLGCTCFVMLPVHFIQKPLRWLQGISRYGVTHSGGPDFAYRLCADNITAEDAKQLNLSTWRVAYNGSEPVRYKTLQTFDRHFRTSGFSRKSFYPCYGLAEATLLVAGQQAAAGPFSIDISEGTAPGGKIQLASAADPKGRRLVSAGKIAPGMEVMIRKLDGSTAATLEEGEICIAGASVTRGYYEHEEPDLFHEADSQYWLRTGDLGFIYKGALFIHGRIKEMLIVRGKNIYPHDVEELVNESHDALVPGGVVLFSRKEHGEEMIVVAEVKRTYVQQVDLTEVLHAIAQVVRGVIGEAPYDIILTTQAGIPRTTSGKRQRLLSRQLYHQGSFSVLAAQQLSPALAPQPGNRETLLQVVRDLGDEGAVRAYLYHVLETKTGRHFLQPIPDTTELTSIGLDSIRTMELINTINKDLCLAIDPSTLLGDNTITGLVNAVEHLYWLQNNSHTGNAIIV